MINSVRASTVMSLSNVVVVDDVSVSAARRCGGGSGPQTMTFDLEPAMYSPPIGDPSLYCSGLAVYSAIIASTAVSRPPAWVRFREYIQRRSSISRVSAAEWVLVLVFMSYFFLLV